MVEKARRVAGIATNVRAPDGLEPAFRRDHADLDWIAPKNHSAGTQKFFESSGCTPRTRPNNPYGRERPLFFDNEPGRQVEVPIGGRPAA